MAGGGGPAKADESAPHPPKDQLPNVSYCITSPPPWPKAILLGFQHYIVTLGTIVLIPTALVPQMGGGKLSFLFPPKNWLSRHHEFVKSLQNISKSRLWLRRVAHLCEMIS